MKRYYKGLLPACLMTGLLWAGCNKDVTPLSLGTSPDGALSRYDLVAADYDVLPVVTFTASYNSEGQMVNLFQKAAQALSSFALDYTGNKLVRSIANDKSVQTVAYDAAGRPARVDYANLTDTGKLVYTYNTEGKLVTFLDSVKVPARLPLIYQYVFTYDAQGNNVVRVDKNRLDSKGRPTLMQYALYTFDDKLNPFKGFPYLRYSMSLPGEVPALVNRNNVLTTQVVGTIPNPASPGSVTVYDTITVYRTGRRYEYNAKGYPLTATENFNDVQFNFSGNRTFKYEY